MDLIIHLTSVAVYAYSFLDIRFCFKVSVSFYTETVRTESTTNWKSGTRRFHLLISDRQMRCRDFMTRCHNHYCDVIVGTMASQITSLVIVCLLSRLFRRRSKKTSKLRVTGLCAGKSPETGEFPHKWSVTRKMFQFDDVIMMAGNQRTIYRLNVSNVFIRGKQSFTAHSILCPVHCWW